MTWKKSKTTHGGRDIACRPVPKPARRFPDNGIDRNYRYNQESEEERMTSRELQSMCMDAWKTCDDGTFRKCMPMDGELLWTDYHWNQINHCSAWTRGGYIAYTDSTGRVNTYRCVVLKSYAMIIAIAIIPPLYQRDNTRASLIRFGRYSATSIQHFWKFSRLIANMGYVDIIIYSLFYEADGRLAYSANGHNYVRINKLTREELEHNGYKYQVDHAFLTVTRGHNASKSVYEEMREKNGKDAKI